MANPDLLFDNRFLERHAGSVINDPAVAIVELVANCWDAYATQVDITWPDREGDVRFSIGDNGEGMTRAEFERRWRTVDYNRLQNQATATLQAPDGAQLPRRKPYGRNGRGRHAAFRFSDPYFVRTWRDGIENSFEVSRGLTQPFEVKHLGSRSNVSGHGTVISAPSATGVGISAEQAREIIGTRFLADPRFVVEVDGKAVTFDDVPTTLLLEADVEVPDFGSAHIVMLNTGKADKTTLQHGVAWRVARRLVGSPSWAGFWDRRLLDGRSTEAKRFTFIVSADFLEDAVKPDWSGFDADAAAWEAARTRVHEKITEMMASVGAQERSEAKATIRGNLEYTVSHLTPLGRDRWNSFVDKVVDSCPTISTSEVQQVAEILANLEASTSKYGLVRKLSALVPNDLDALNGLLGDWTVTTAKIALDEIQGRLTLLAQLETKLRDSASDEVGELQPLFEQSLWVFGPEFESIEYTSNRAMTTVIRELFGATGGSVSRPDFVIIPDGSVGLYSRDAFDEELEVRGVARLVIAEIKRPGIPIGVEQKDQAWRYVKELINRGHVDDATKVTCFVLGSELERGESSERTERDGRVVIVPMTYDRFVRRAEKRMLGLREKLSAAPFLRGLGLDAASFVAENAPDQKEFDLVPH